MSMQRRREVKKPRERDATSDYWSKKEPDRAYDWKADVASRPDDDFVAYATSCRFDRGSLVYHRKFGKGIVTQTDGTNLDVLFEDAAKKLKHDPGGGSPGKARVLPRELLRRVLWTLDQ